MNSESLFSGAVAAAQQVTTACFAPILLGVHSIHQPQLKVQESLHLNRNFPSEKKKKKKKKKKKRGDIYNIFRAHCISFNSQNPLEIKLMAAYGSWLDVL
jgi:hypothetical protein